jgi:hypothetical protein
MMIYYLKECKFASGAYARRSAQEWRTAFQKLHSLFFPVTSRSEAINNFDFYFDLIHLFMMPAAYRKLYFS